MSYLPFSHQREHLFSSKCAVVYHNECQSIPFFFSFPVFVVGKEMHLNQWQYILRRHLLLQWFLLGGRRPRHTELGRAFCIFYLLFYVGANLT